jgi:hypothetical protein
MRESLIELRVSRELALKIGCIEPSDRKHHRELRAGRLCMLVRDPETLAPLFWPIIPLDQSIYTSS